MEIMWIVSINFVCLVVSRLSYQTLNKCLCLDDVLRHMTKWVHIYLLTFRSSSANREMSGFRLALLVTWVSFIFCLTPQLQIHSRSSVIL